MKKYLTIIVVVILSLLLLIGFLSYKLTTQNDLKTWGPDRKTFTTQDPANYVTFNSIVDNPAHGDERNFMQIRETDASNDDYRNVMELTAGKEYVIFIYFQNDGSSSLLKDGIADGAYVKAQIPSLVRAGKMITEVIGYVGASNANPNEVWDSVYLINTNGKDLKLSFVPGSAIIHTFGDLDGNVISDDISTVGAPIGFDLLNGKISAEDKECSGFVTFKIKAQ